MSKNNSTTLTQARRAKKDEFYTSFEDIAREMETYVECDPKVFSGRAVYYARAMWRQRVRLWSSLPRILTVWD